MTDKHERQVKWICFPQEIFDHPELTDAEKMIFAEIDSYTGNDKECFISNETFAKQRNCSESKISRAIANLTERGYIAARFDGRKRFLRSLLIMTWQPAHNDEADSANYRHTKQDTKQITTTAEEVVVEDVKSEEPETETKKESTMLPEITKSEEFIDGYCLWVNKKEPIKNMAGFKKHIKTNLKNIDFSDYEMHLKVKEAAKNKPSLKMPYDPADYTPPHLEVLLKEYEKIYPIVKGSGIFKVDLEKLISSLKLDFPEFEELYKTNRHCRALVHVGLYKRTADVYNLKKE